MMQEGPTFPDRRAEPRAGATFPVQYKLLDEKGQEQRQVCGSAVNVSDSGLRFQTDEQLQTGCVVAAEFNLPGSESEVVAVGKVVWCRPSDQAGFDVGMEFWWLGWRDEHAQQALADYVQSKLNGPQGPTAGATQ